LAKVVALVGDLLEVRGEGDIARVLVDGSRLSRGSGGKSLSFCFLKLLYRGIALGDQLLLRRSFLIFGRVYRVLVREREVAEDDEDLDKVVAVPSGLEVDRVVEVTVV
jgi:hypothetical protein